MKLLSKASDVPVMIKQDNFALSSMRIEATDLPDEVYTVERGSPTVIFSDEITKFLPNNVALVLATIDSKTIGTGSRSLDISNTLFSISVGANISGLSDPIIIIFPKVR